MMSDPDLNSSEKGLEANEDTELSATNVTVTVKQPPLEEVDGGLKAWSTLVGA